MAKFEEDKIITALHPEKAEVGKIYFYSDELLTLKDCVEDDKHRAKLRKINADCNEAFLMESDYAYRFLYPYEEPPKQRMTNEQLAEWLAKGNGLLLADDDIIYTYYESRKEYLEIETTETFLIRPFGQTEWIEPTVDIYERDCKGGKE